MATFSASITASQSSDGKTLNIVDTSNYSVNDQGYVVAGFTTRNVLVKDSSGTLLATIALGINLTTTYALTSDKMLDLTLNLAGVATFTKTITIPLRRLTRNLYRSLLSLAGCCSNPSQDKALMYSDIFLTGADFEATSTNGAAFDENISTAAVFLNSVN